MNNVHFSSEEDGILVAKAGSFAADSIKEAILISQKEKGRLVRFRLARGEPPLNVLGDSNPELIYRDWRRAMNGYISLAGIGPYPVLVFSDKEKENDARRERMRNLSRMWFQWRRVTKSLFQAVWEVLRKR